MKKILIPLIIIASIVTIHAETISLKNFPVIVPHISDYSHAISWYSIFYAHSIHCKSILEFLTKEKHIDFSVFFAEEDDIYTAMFLHDIGAFFLISFLYKYLDVLNTVKRLSFNLYDIENMLVGTNHAIIGGYIASKWGLPNSLVYAISYHHTPNLSNKYRNMLKFISIIDMLSVDYITNKEIKKEIEPKIFSFFRGLSTKKLNAAVNEGWLITINKLKELDLEYFLFGMRTQNNMSLEVF
jgi:hypothetical protein